MAGSYDEYRLKELQDELYGGNINPYRKQALESEIFNIQQAAKRGPQQSYKYNDKKERLYDDDRQGYDEARMMNGQRSSAQMDMEFYYDPESKTIRQRGVGQTQGKSTEASAADSQQYKDALSQLDSLTKDLSSRDRQLSEKDAEIAALKEKYGTDFSKQGVSEKTRQMLEQYQQGYNPGESVTKAQERLAGLDEQRPGDYTESESVLKARQLLEELQGKRPGEYTESESVLKARQMLEELQGKRPGEYQSKYSEQLGQLLDRIQNPEKFSYEFNGDNLFKAYQDYYTQLGKQANLNAQGEAAALSGGYGNSFAQSAGQQANQQYLLGLMDKGMELRDRAYQEYQNDRAQELNQYNTLLNADQTDYGRYRDSYNDWMTELGRAAQQEMAER